MSGHLPPRAKSWILLAAWTAGALLVAIGILAFVGRSYVVHGISMEPTLHNGDVIFANKLERSISGLTGKPFIPARDSLVVFSNPFYNQGDQNMFIVKRVIGLPGDRVIVGNGRITIYPNDDASKAFNPDDGVTGPQSPTSGSVNIVVPDGEIFVAGDNRLDNNSLDSRNGMSTVPVSEIQGVVALRLWPLAAFLIF